MTGGRRGPWLAALLLASLATAGAQEAAPSLRDLVLAEDTDAVARLLAEGTVDVDVTDEEGWTALMYAVRDGSDALVEGLLEAGSQPDLTNPGGETPLHLAARYGRPRAARQLLRAGADFAQQDGDGRTPLYRAIENRQADIIEMLQAAALAQRKTLGSQAAAGTPDPALPPRIVESLPAPYTESARAQGIEGTVVLMVLVRRDGSVGAANVSQGLEASLDHSAQDTVRRWKFAPAMRGGRTVDVVLEVKVKFELPEAPEGPGS